MGFSLGPGAAALQAGLGVVAQFGPDAATPSGESKPRPVASGGAASATDRPMR